MTITDARGVDVKPGATVIYGFGVGRSVAMAEGVVEEKDGEVSVTPSGRLWVHVVRRSYSSGTEQRVHVASDRLVVVDALPPSPQPTQNEGNLTEWRATCDRYRTRLAALAEGGELQRWEVKYPRSNVIDDYGKWLRETEKKIREATGD
ncbi:hypothetical protein [Streptomyces sp. NBC_00687]|uniref:hypothetical protein n=1 Tax=Streptomyces sp. NBC_00687 TaxID=2975807 RepID=UPI00224D4EC7|nr:hypothetical protein [Streptomyces sp. NBC_00687]MCX4912835.1 hypothetical protein [Streptomyces sp. NBC_00687]